MAERTTHLCSSVSYPGRKVSIICGETAPTGRFPCCFSKPAFCQSSGNKWTEVRAGAASTPIGSETCLLRDEGRMWDMESEGQEGFRSLV